MISIGLDISKVSTALCIKKKGKILLYSYTTEKSNNIWVRETSDFINYRNINYSYLQETIYSKKEIFKLKEFNDITTLIFNDIVNNVDILDSVKISIEGFSYKSNGPIIDIVEFSTMLKYKLMTLLKGYVDIEIKSPLTLKTEACKLVYQPRIEKKGKRVIKEILHYENTSGKQATKFDKRGMMICFLDSDIDLDLKEYLLANKDEIMKLKKIPKPFDDMVDSIFLMELNDKNKNHGKS